MPWFPSPELRNHQSKKEPNECPNESGRRTEDNEPERRLAHIGVKTHDKNRTDDCGKGTDRTYHYSPRATPRFHVLLVGLFADSLDRANKCLRQQAHGSLGQGVPAPDHTS